MGGGMGSFVEGLAGGIQQGQKQAMASQLQGMQMQHLKTTNKAAELALKMEQAKGGIFDAMTPEEQRATAFPKADDTLEAKLAAIQKMMSGGATPGPFAPPEPYGGGTAMFPLDPSVTAPSQSLPQQIAQGQTLPGGLTMDDLLRGVMKKELGAEPMKYSRIAQVIMPDGNPGTAPMREDGLIDLSKATPAPFKLDTQKGVGPGMVPTEVPVNPYTRQSAGAPIQTGPPPTRVVETPTAGGGATSSVVPIFGGGGGRGTKVTGTGPGGVRTQLDLLDVPIPGTEVTKWSDGQGNSPPVGWTPRQAQGRGFKQTQEGMPAETGGKVVMLSQAVGDMEKAIEMILPKTGGFNRKLAIGVWANAPEFAVEGSQIVRSAILNAMSAKLRMETGAQSNESEIQGIIDRYRPSGVRDNEKSARYKMGRLLSFMRDGKFLMDPKGRIVVVDPPTEKKKPDLSLGKKRDPAAMTDAELLKALQ